MQIQFPSHSFPFLCTPVFNYAQLFLITFSPRAVDIVKCPWSSFFIYDTLILTILHYITLHTSTVAELSTSHGRVHTHTHTHAHTVSVNERTNGWVCLVADVKSHTPTALSTRSSATTDGPRDALCQSKSCQRWTTAGTSCTTGARFTKYLTAILRLSYDNAKVTINLRWTYNGCLIYKTSYTEREAFHRQDSRAKS